MSDINKLSIPETGLDKSTITDAKNGLEKLAKLKSALKALSDIDIKVTGLDPHIKFVEDTLTSVANKILPVKE